MPWLSAGQLGLGLPHVTCSSLYHWNIKVESKGLSSCRLQSSQGFSFLAASQKPESIPSLCPPPQPLSAFLSLLPRDASSLLFDTASCYSDLLLQDQTKKL